MNGRALVISLVIGALTTLLLGIYLQRLEVQTAGGGPVVVMAAVKPLEPGVQITPEMLAPKVVPQAYVESRAVRKADLARIVGLRVETAVKPQQTLMWTDLAVTSDDKKQLSGLVQTGMRAMGIHATSDDAHFALIRPGDRVDVYANMPQAKSETETLSVLVVQSVLVLAVGLDTGMRETPASNDRAEHTLTVSVTPQQLQLVSLAQLRGKLTIAVRNPEDTRLVEHAPELPSSVLTGAPQQAFAKPSGVPGPVLVKKAPE